MKFLATISLVLSGFFLHGQSLPAWGQEAFKKFKDKYTIENYIDPPFLQADLSGDKKIDLAILIERKTDQKKGILILLGQRDKIFIIGSGNNFGNAGDDFDWAGQWGIFTEHKTYETTFKENGDVAGGKEVLLKRPAIFMKEDEGSGGLIYFDGESFIWIHQGD